MTYTNPRERRAASKRQVPVVYRKKGGDTALSLSCSPRSVEDLVKVILAKGCEIMTVDGKVPPPGSDGACAYDGGDSGPYWLSDL